jgi:A/G-specific adenine glycosylase
MLQQTQVVTVIPYYERFLKRYPTVAHLAAADEQDVLRLWEGLGYYRRARQLHAAAKQLVADHGGQFPSSIEAARRLPGIGRYTAGAILSFAFDARQPILEANTLRLFARLLGYRGDPLNAAGQRLLWSAAAAILPSRNSGTVNQALMELGSQVCLPRQPRCEACPVNALCATSRDGLQQVIPRPPAKSFVEHVREAAVVLRDGQLVLLIQHAHGRRWAGLWDFPRFAVADGPEPPGEQVALHVAANCSLSISIGQRLATIRHGVTRFRITLEVYCAQLAAGRRRTRIDSKHADRGGANGEIQPRYAQQRWVRIDELSEYPLNTTGRRIATMLISDRAVYAPRRRYPARASGSRR